jgi:hypothetical protein
MFTFTDVTGDRMSEPAPYVVGPSPISPTALDFPASRILSRGDDFNLLDFCGPFTAEIKTWSPKVAFERTAPAPAPAPMNRAQRRAQRKRR